MYPLIIILFQLKCKHADTQSLEEKKCNSKYLLKYVWTLNLNFHP